jgi:hypothetical protein
MNPIGADEDASQFKGLIGPLTDNEDEDCPPEFTSLAIEQEKCKFNLVNSIIKHFKN